MKAVTQRAVFAAIIATLTLAGCASAPDTEPELAAAGSGSAADAKPVLTGSRIPSNRTEKMLHQVGSQDYKQNKEAMPSPLRTQ